MQNIGCPSPEANNIIKALVGRLDNVTEVKLSIAVGEIVKIEITHFMSPLQVDELTHTLKKIKEEYQLVKIENSNDK